MAIHEIPYEDAHGDYKSIAGSDDDFETGQVFVTPPFTPGDAIINELNEDLGQADLVAVTRGGVVLSFDTSSTELDSVNLRKKALDDAVGMLMVRANTASSRSRFIEDWGMAQ